MQPSLFAAILFLAITTASSFKLEPHHFQYNPRYDNSSNPNVGLERHFVSWLFTNETTPEQAQEIQDRYFDLFDLCTDPFTGERYILSFDGGVPNSLEGFQHNVTQAYIMTFPSVEARNYFVGRPYTDPYDPHHDAFKAFVGPFLYKPIQEGLYVVDFIVEDIQVHKQESHKKQYNRRPNKSKPILLPGYF